MNLVSANVAVVWRFGSLYRDGLLQTATIRGCSMASRVSEPEPHITHSTHSTTHSNCQHDRHSPGTVPFPNMSHSCCDVALIFVECINPHHAHYLLSINYTMFLIISTDWQSAAFTSLWSVMRRNQMSISPPYLMPSLGWPHWKL